MLAMALLAIAAVTPLDHAESGTPLGRADQRDREVPYCNDADSLFVTTIVHPHPLRPHPFGDERAVLAFADSTDDTGHRVLATVHDVGSSFGLAFDPYRAHLYVGAYPRSQLGPGGMGAIYRINLDRNTVDRFAALDAGEVPNYIDLAPWIGKSGIGDLELSEDASVLFAVNLYDRRIYRFSLPDGTVLGSFSTGEPSAPWAPNARPFALAFNEGWLYHGVVDSRESATLPGGLTGYIYRSRPDGSSMTEVARFSLAYDRERAWHPWTDAVPSTDNFVVDYDAQPMLTDIAFQANGDMVIGLRDRVGEIVRHSAMPQNHTGDILPGHRNGSAWQIQTEPEWYEDHTIIDEGALGTLAIEPNRRQVLTTASAPDGEWRHPSGVLWLSDVSGRIVGREILYDHHRAQSFTPTMGDLERVCRKELPPTSTANPSTTPRRPTATLASTLTPTLAPSPTATTEPEIRPVYLPLVLNESCIRRQVHADVVLVLDTSTSMLRETRAGRTKLRAMQAAADTFIGLMELEPNRGLAHDQLAVVGFNNRAWIQHSLSVEEGALRQSVASLSEQVAEGTRLDLALRWGSKALQSPIRSSDNTPVLILLTDGMPNRVPTPQPSGSQEETVIAEAAAAKELGARVYTIGVGVPDATDPAERINPLLLRAVASKPSMYYETPDAEDLARIYSEIAYEIGCPRERVWGRR